MQPVQFRGAALERISSPDQADHLLVITDRRAWVAVALVAIVLVAALVWAVAGKVAVEIPAQGVLVREGGAFHIVSAEPGVVVETRVAAGDAVSVGQIVGVVRTPAGDAHQVQSSIAGTAVELLADQGSYVQRGTPLVSLERTDLPIEAAVFVPLADAKRVPPGMLVYLLPASAPAQESGYLVGRVRSVGSFPATPEGLNALFHNASLVGAVLRRGPEVRLTVDLLRDGSDPHAYRWTTGRGLAAAVVSGMPCKAFVRVGERRPISFLLPAQGDRAPR